MAALCTACAFPCDMFLPRLVVDVLRRRSEHSHNVMRLLRNATQRALPLVPMPVEDVLIPFYLVLVVDGCDVGPTEGRRDEPKTIPSFLEVDRC